MLVAHIHLPQMIPAPLLVTATDNNLNVLRWSVTLCLRAFCVYVACLLGRIRAAHDKHLLLCSFGEIIVATIPFCLEVRTIVSVLG